MTTPNPKNVKSGRQKVTEPLSMTTSNPKNVKSGRQEVTEPLSMTTPNPKNVKSGHQEVTEPLSMTTPNPKNVTSGRQEVTEPLLKTTSNPKNVPSGHQELNVVLFSKTGHGKSSLANALIQTDKFKVSHAMTSETVKCQCEVRDTDAYSLKVVDTPGSMDTINPDDALREIFVAITHSVEGFHAVLLVIRLGVKLTKEERMAIELLGRLFGKEAFNYCIVVFTHGDVLKNNQQGFEAYLDSNRKGVKMLDDLLNKCSNRAVMVDTSMEANPGIQTTQINRLIELISSMAKRDNPVLTGEYFELAKQTFEDEKRKLREEREMQEKQLQLLKDARMREVEEKNARRREGEKERARERAAAMLTEEAKKKGDNCFPSGAMVQTPDGPIPINLLSVGQSVLCSYNNKLIYSPVYMWGHRDETTCSNSFVTITTESAQLTLSSDHLLPIIDEMGDEVSVPAGEVSSGNTVQVLHHMHDKSQEIRSEKVLSVETGVNRTGLFAPFTMCGTVIVDDVVASCYIRCLPHGVSHALLWPVRVGWRFSPSAVSFCNELESDGMCWWVRVISNRVLPMVKWLGVGSDGKSWLMSVISNGMFYSNPACQFK